MANVGAGGVGVYKQKSGYQFQMKNINAGSSKITITDDTTNDEVDIDLGSHASEHEDGGGDEINVGSLSGLLGDPQTPIAHQLATSGGTPYHTGSLPLTDLNSYGVGRLIYGGASDWQFLAPSTQNFALRMGATYPEWAEVISNNAFDETWNNITAIGASKDALYDAINPLVAGVIYAGTWNPTSPDGLFPNNLSNDTDGYTVASTDDFKDDTATFQTDGVAIGDILLIEEGADEGYYIISAVDSQTQVSCTGANFTGVTSLTYQIFEVPTGGDFYITTADGQCYNQFYENGDWLIWNETTTKWDRIRTFKGDNWVSVSPGDNIQTAIDEVLGTGGGTVFIEPGTHTLTATLTVNSVGNYLRLMGAGDASLIDCNGDRRAISITNCEYCTIANIKVDATDITTSNMEAIHVNEANDNVVTIQDVAIDLPLLANDGYGIELESEYCYVTGCNIDGGSRGVSLSTTGHNCQIIANSFTNTDANAVQGVNVHDCIIANNVCDVAGDYALGIIFMSGNRNIITGNTFTMSGTGPFAIYLSYGDLNVVSDNVISNGYWGIGIGGSSGDCTRNIINANIITGCSAGGNLIDTAEGATENVISNNIIYNNTWSTSTNSGVIYLRNGSDRNLIIGNIISNNTNTGTGSTYGVYVNSTGDNDNVVIGNIMTGNDYDYVYEPTGANTRRWDDLKVYGWSYGTGYVGIGHRALTGAGNYAILIQNNGQLFLNAPTGQNVRIRINNTDRLIVNSASTFDIYSASDWTNSVKIAYDTAVARAMRLYNNSNRDCFLANANDFNPGHYVIHQRNTQGYIRFYTNNTLRWEFINTGHLRPTTDGQMNLGESAYSIASFYRCNEYDGTCADFEHYTLEELYQIFAQIKPMSDGGLHYSPETGIAFPHLDFATLPDEFAVKAKEVITNSLIYYDDGKGALFTPEIEYAIGEAFMIDSGVWDMALMKLVVKLYEKVIDLESRLP